MRRVNTLVFTLVLTFAFALALALALVTVIRGLTLVTVLRFDCSRLPRLFECGFGVASTIMHRLTLLSLRGCRSFAFALHR